MRNPGGYLIITDPEIGCPIETDTFTCKHCNVVVPVPPRSVSGGMCLKCNGLICNTCVDVGECRPFEKWLDKVERNLDRDRLFHSVTNNV